MPKKIRVIAIVGTRPEAIKMAPVVRDLRARESFEVFLLSTGQHQEMLRQVLGAFDLVPDHDLSIMSERQGLNEILARALPGLDRVYREVRPDVVLVQGDTSTAFIAGLAAFNHQIRVGHIEAGLRSFDKRQPFPEEVNRRLLSVIADDHFAPTDQAQNHLIQEGINASDIFVTGNTVIDALLSVIRPDHRFSFAEVSTALTENSGTPVILVTAHRRENWGQPLVEICQAVKALSRKRLAVFIWPVHLNPVVRERVHTELAGEAGVYLTEPLDYSDLANLLSRVDLIWTDSGGIQEEAPSLGKPILVLREVTERPEGVSAGTALLVGTDRERLVRSTIRLLTDHEYYHQISAAKNPYGDGQASRRIGDFLLWRFDLSSSRPDPFTSSQV